MGAKELGGGGKTPSPYSGAEILLAVVVILADITGLSGTAFLLVLRDGSIHLRSIVPNEQPVARLCPAVAANIAALPKVQWRS